MIRFGPLDESHVAAHNAGEDSEVVRWLTGLPATEASTRRHFAMLAANARTGTGKRGFGVWLDDRLAGYIDFELDAAETTEKGDVNLAYSVHPWARRRGVATAAVNLICAYLMEQRIGTRAIIRTERDSEVSALVARRCGFVLITPAGVTGVADPEYLTWMRPLYDTLPFALGR